MSREHLADRYREVRRHSEALAAPLSPEDAVAQSMPDASPAKWHLAHTTWFFETFVLAPHVPGFVPHDTHYRVLFNSYYHGVGAQHPRAQRGLLTRPSLAEVAAYRQAVDQQMLALLPGCAEALLPLIELGLQHEQQHQELLLTDVLHLFFCQPSGPAYRAEAADARSAPPFTMPASQWVSFEGGLVPVGHDGVGFAFDNEGPRHEVFLAPFDIASRLVTQAEYAGFVEAGAYRQPSCWLSDGWAWRQAQDRSHPLYWRRGTDGAWEQFGLQGWSAMRADDPVSQLSYYEADAYARWVGARLPTEEEWEHAASTSARLHQLDQHVWQWTASAYLPYPGYRVPEGAVGEYNGKFMVNQMVLRGGSVVTPRSHVRRTYRNFFPPHASWQFSGVRLARDRG